MLKFTRISKEEHQHQAKLFSLLTLTLDQRTRSRLKVTLDNGLDAGLFLPRGTILNHHDLLLAESGEIIQVVAAHEPVSTVYCEDTLVLARACYHLGNRHVPLQITNDFIRYQHDHVLDDMVRGLGLTVVTEQVPFEPEPGAYGGHASGHTHAH